MARPSAAKDRLREASLSSPLPWIASGEVTLQPDIEGFIARTVAKKRDQHRAHASKAILGVDSMFPDADDLAEAFRATGGSIPWWRVYLVCGSDATLVWETGGETGLVPPERA